MLTSRIQRNSGHSALDRAALDMLTRAQPLPKPPAEIVAEPIDLVVPVELLAGRRG